MFDIVMPKMDGFSLYIELKKEEMIEVSKVLFKRTEELREAIFKGR